MNRIASIVQWKLIAASMSLLYASTAIGIPKSTLLTSTVTNAINGFTGSSSKTCGNEWKRTAMATELLTAITLGTCFVMTSRFP